MEGAEDAGGALGDVHHVRHQREPLGPPGPTPRATHRGAGCRERNPPPSTPPPQHHSLPSRPTKTVGKRGGPWAKNDHPVASRLEGPHPERLRKLSGRRILEVHLPIDLCRPFPNALPMRVFRGGVSRVGFASDHRIGGTRPHATGGKGMGWGGPPAEADTGDVGLEKDVDLGRGLVHRLLHRDQRPPPARARGVTWGGGGARDLYTALAYGAGLGWEEAAGCGWLRSSFQSAKTFKKLSSGVAGGCAPPPCARTSS